MGQQFEVQLPNRPGELAHLAKALCARGVNIVQVHQTTAGDLVCAEIFTDCCDEDTTEVLRSMGYPFVAGKALTIEIEDTPCALGEVSDKLAGAGVHMANSCILGRANGLATWALSVDNEEQARQVLSKEPTPDTESAGGESAGGEDAAASSGRRRRPPRVRPRKS